VSKREKNNSNKERLCVIQARILRETLYMEKAECKR